MATPAVRAGISKLVPRLPRQLLNAYELRFSERTWGVSLYKGTSTDGNEASHERRGTLKNAVWEFRKTNKRACPGPHYYVIDVAPDIVAVPTAWNIPAHTEAAEFIFQPIGNITVDLDNPDHDPIIQGLLREAFKQKFKEVTQDGPLGFLWQSYNEFCQVPVPNGNDYLFCRRFGFNAVVLRGRQWCMQVCVSTQTVDGRTFEDYFQLNETGILAENINLKRINHRKRSNRPADVAVLHMEQTGNGDGWTARRLELVDPDAVTEMCRQVANGNRKAWRPTLACKQFNKDKIDIAPDELRLVLDSQITQEDHQETIIEPAERMRLHGQIRSLLDPTDVFGVAVGIIDQPIDAGRCPGGVILPPAIRVREGNGEGVILAPEGPTEAMLNQRGRDRSRKLKENGLLVSRPMSPLLACPTSRFSSKRAERLRHDLNAILEDQNLPFRFGTFRLYHDVQDIRNAVAGGEFDSALVVLPEGKRQPNSSNSLHEQAKRKLIVPSQCIQYDNTFHDKSGEYLIPGNSATGAVPLPRRIQEHYINCIWGLAVKCHCIPFAPAEPFFYDVHVGIDVGGRDNNKAVLCIGYGFNNPRERLVFLAEEIPIEGAKSEPIPVEPLVEGMLSGFERLAADLERVGRPFDLTRTLFFRDGPMLGDSTNWNERDAFQKVFTKASERGWIHGEPLWTLVEVSKTAEGWRLFASLDEVRNPLVGRWSAPFEDPNRVILATTGAPYLSQGTASPLLLTIEDVFGNASREQVLRDVVWEADMCFTKPDMGMKLPWVLYVANEGALQAARCYEICGIPV